MRGDQGEMARHRPPGAAEVDWVIVESSEHVGSCGHAISSRTITASGIAYPSYRPQDPAARPCSDSARSLIRLGPIHCVL